MFKSILSLLMLCSASVFAVPSFLDVEVHVTSAELKTLYTTPVEIIAAQGAGKIIQVCSYEYRYNYAGNDVFTSAGILKLTPPNWPFNSDFEGYANGTSLLKSPESRYASGKNAGQYVISASSYEDQPIVLRTSGPILGNPSDDNSLDVYVVYMVLDL